MFCETKSHQTKAMIALGGDLERCSRYGRPDPCLPVVITFEVEPDQLLHSGIPRSPALVSLRDGCAVSVHDLEGPPRLLLSTGKRR